MRGVGVEREDGEGSERAVLKGGVAAGGNGGVGEAGGFEGGGSSDPHAGNQAGKARAGGSPGWDIWGWHLAATLC